MSSSGCFVVIVVVGEVEDGEQRENPVRRCDVVFRHRRCRRVSSVSRRTRSSTGSGGRIPFVVATSSSGGIVVDDCVVRPHAREVKDGEWRENPVRVAMSFSGGVIVIVCVCMVDPHPDRPKTDVPEATIKHSQLVVSDFLGTINPNTFA